MRWRGPIGWATVCLACAACGGAVHQAASTGARSTSTGPITLPAQPAADGAHVFAHDCQSCHSLIGNESAHKQGGDLLGYNMTRSQLLTFTREMPTRPLTAAQLSAVVDYVLRAQQRGHR
jgi:mono/diheme cytochrome c family protein